MKETEYISGTEPVFRSSSIQNLLAALAFLLAITVISGCSINKLAVRAVASALSSGGSSGALTGDDDPELVADALPRRSFLCYVVSRETRPLPRSPVQCSRNI